MAGNTSGVTSPNSNDPSASTTLSAHRSSFSVISSEELSEMAWFDPEILLSPGTGGLLASPVKNPDYTSYSLIYF